MNINWGVLGAANIAVRSVIPAILSVKKNKVVAIASRNIETARVAAAPFNCVPVEGYDALLLRDDINAVYIPLPTGLHREWVIKALEAGKHVLVEKSAGIDLKEATDMVDCARKNRLVLVENFQFTQHSQHQFVKGLISNGVIGEMRSFRSSFGFPPFDGSTNIRYKKELGGGALLDAGAYTLRVSSFFLGEDLKVKAAQLIENDKYGVDWFGGAFMTDADQRIFSEISFGFENYYQCNYEIWGSDGKITSTRAFTAKSDYAPPVIIETDGKVQEKILKPDDHFHNMIQHFNKLIDEFTPEQEWQNILTQARLLQDVRNMGAHHAIP